MGIDRPGGLTVFYDGACPKCVKDRETYERMAGKTGCDVCWFDITGEDEALLKLGIDPHRALKELHVKDGHQTVHTEIDAYILLMNRVPVLVPIARIIALPLVRPVIRRIYHSKVKFRLWRANRL